MRLQVLDLAKTMKLLLASADARAAAAAATKSGCQACLSRHFGQESIQQQPPCTQQQVRAVSSGSPACSSNVTGHQQLWEKGSVAMHVLLQLHV
jgi:hypothetical protein